MEFLFGLNNIWKLILFVLGLLLLFALINGLLSIEDKINKLIKELWMNIYEIAKWIGLIAITLMTFYFFIKYMHIPEEK